MLIYSTTPLPGPIHLNFQFEEDRMHEPLNCPVCKAVMAKEEYKRGALVILLVCKNGHVIWLEKGELQYLENYFEKFNEATKDSYLDIVKNSLARFRDFFTGKITCFHPA